MPRRRRGAGGKLLAARANSIALCRAGVAEAKHKFISFGRAAVYFAKGPLVFLGAGCLAFAESERRGSGGRRSEPAQIPLSPTHHFFARTTQRALRARKPHSITRRE